MLWLFNLLVCQCDLVLVILSHDTEERHLVVAGQHAAAALLRLHHAEQYHHLGAGPLQMVQAVVLRRETPRAERRLFAGDHQHGQATAHPVSLAEFGRLLRDTPPEAPLEERVLRALRQTGWHRPALVRHAMRAWAGIARVLLDAAEDDVAGLEALESTLPGVDQAVRLLRPLEGVHLPWLRSSLIGSLSLGLTASQLRRDIASAIRSQWAYFVWRDDNEYIHPSRGVIRFLTVN